MDLDGKIMLDFNQNLLRRWMNGFSDATHRTKRTHTQTHTHTCSDHDS